MSKGEKDWVLYIPVSFPCSLRVTAADDGNTPAAEYHAATPTLHRKHFAGKLLKLNDFAPGRINTSS